MTGAAAGGSATMQPFLPILSGRPGSAPTSAQTHPGLQTHSLAGVSATPASQAVANQPPTSSSTAQQLSGLSAIPVSRARPTESPVPVVAAQQTDSPMPQASAPQPQSQPEQASSAPVLAAPNPSASAAAAVPRAAEPLPQAEAPSPVSAPEAASGAAPEARLVSSTEAPPSLAIPDARGTSEPQAQQFSSTDAELRSSPGLAAEHEISASPEQAPLHNREKGTGETSNPVEKHALSNGNGHVRAENISGNELRDQTDTSQLQKQTDVSEAPAQQKAGAVGSMPQVSAPAAHMQDSKQQNGAVQSSPAQSMSDAAAVPASAAPGQHPAPQLSVPAAQAGLAGQPGQAAANFPPSLGSAQPEQLPISAAVVQRPGSLTKASPLPSLASTVTQQWLGSSQGSAVRPAPQQGEHIPTSSLQSRALWPLALPRLQTPIFASKCSTLFIQK